jgi:DNA-binding MarR family transcriptional regulator
MSQNFIGFRTPSGIPYLIGYLDRLVVRQLNEAISLLGLTIQQYTALSVIGAEGRLSNAKLAKRSLVSPQSANEMVKTLVKHGWIGRSPDPSHGRIILLYLTPQGEEILRLAHNAAAEFEEKMLNNLTPHERKQFREFLNSNIKMLV